MRFLPMVVLLAACGSPQVRDTGLDGLSLDSANPGLLLPGTRVVLRGKSFVDIDLGASRLVFDGTLSQAPLHFEVGAHYVSPSQLEVPVDAAFASALNDNLDGTLDGTFTIKVNSTVDLKAHLSAPLPVHLTLSHQSTPSFGKVLDGATYVNQPIEVDGDGFLLGGDEGQLLAHLTGCFTAMGQTTCGPDIDVEIPAQPKSEFDRTSATFPYATLISGIGPGHFAGQLEIINKHQNGVTLNSATLPVALDVQRPHITGASTTAASLGEYVIIDGAGFVGGNDDESTVISLQGNFVDRAGKTTPLDLVLVPEFLSGPQMRYVLDETDPLGSVIDLRTDAGTITGTVRPTVQKGTEKLTGDPVVVQLQVLPIKQVIYLQFQSSYTASLRLFGMRAADAVIRARALVHAQQIYQSLNVEFREEIPTDFALYSVVDILGPDPNGLGAFGGDNTPGKDVGNLRLYDHIGGVNATTQADGSPGFGGIFVEAFFSFSEHPKGLAEQQLSDPLFDQIFDPFRPDVGGDELTADELTALAPPTLTSGDSCPADGHDRRMQIACAIWALGNLVASTMVHEVGHSLGLADPYGPMDSYHNVGDLPDRLMEVGSARPFTERAILGDGPAHFCTDEYVYLRKILPSDDPETTFTRPSCD
jgi:hypothetical protein